MPDFKPDVLYLINLYSKCKETRSLPKAGGVLDQPAWLMEVFSVIDGARESFQANENERLERERAVRDLKGKGR